MRFVRYFRWLCVPIVATLLFAATINYDHPLATTWLVVYALTAVAVGFCWLVAKQSEIRSDIVMVSIFAGGVVMLILVGGLSWPESHRGAYVDGQMGLLFFFVPIYVCVVSLACAVLGVLIREGVKVLPDRFRRWAGYIFVFSLAVLVVGFAAPTIRSDYTLAREEMRRINLCIKRYDNLTALRSEHPKAKLQYGSLEDDCYYAASDDLLSSLATESSSDKSDPRSELNLDPDGRIRARFYAQI